MGRGDGEGSEILYGKAMPRRRSADSAAPSGPPQIKPCTDLEGGLDCDGHVHYELETVPECCGNILPTGECCGNAVPGQEWVEIGPYPNLPEGFEREPELPVVDVSF